MLSQKTILLVEDNPGDTALFLIAAREACPKATIVTVATAGEATQCLEGTGKYTDRKEFPLPVMAFVDLGLPDISGQDLIKWIRKQPQFKKLPIAVFTGATDARVLADLYRWGADSFLLKTPEIKELAMNLRELTAYWLERGLVATSPCLAPASNN
jgi:CheY-like chemotaxis protein